MALNDIPSQEEKLSELGKEIESIYGANSSQRCVVTLGDVSSEGDVKRMFDEVVNQLGGLDVVSTFCRGSHRCVDTSFLFCC